MASAKNQVIAGDYEGAGIGNSFGEIFINSRGGSIPLTKDFVEAYELVTEETRKSAASGIMRGAVGGLILGPVGLLAGLSAKNKGICTVAIQFKDGKRSLIEISDKHYKALVTKMF